MSRGNWSFKAYQLRKDGSKSDRIAGSVLGAVVVGVDAVTSPDQVC